jgi:hypothetical protein
VVDGKRTAWCAQHDEIDYSPASGRTYELVSLCGAESADILRFLMSLDDPSPEVAEAITAGVAWFESAKLTGIRQTRVDGDKVIVEDADARPLWARFYEIGTNRPIFCGRDGVQKYSLAEIEAERRNGYAWYGDWGRPVASEYAKWQKKWPAPADTKEDTAADLKVIQLTCEYARDPLGVDVSNPRLSWKLESDVRARQNAYRILLAPRRNVLRPAKATSGQRQGHLDETAILPIAAGSWCPPSGSSGRCGYGTSRAALRRGAGRRRGRWPARPRRLAGALDRLSDRQPVAVPAPGRDG